MNKFPFPNFYRRVFDSDESHCGGYLSEDSDDVESCDFDFDPLEEESIPTNEQIVISKMQTWYKNKYFHVGVDKYLSSFLSQLPKGKIQEEIMLVNIDGITLTNSSGSKFWPIPCSV